MEVDFENKRMYQNLELSDLDFEGITAINELCLFNSKLNNITFKNCDLRSVDFRMSELNKVKFINCKFNKCDFGLGAKLINCKIQDCLFDIMYGGDKTILDNTTILNSTLKYIDIKTKEYASVSLGEVWK